MRDFISRNTSSWQKTKPTRTPEPPASTVNPRSVEGAALKRYFKQQDKYRK
jgi:hypothetical protein